MFTRVLNLGYRIFTKWSPLYAVNSSVSTVSSLGWLDGTLTRFWPQNGMSFVYHCNVCEVLTIPSCVEAAAAVAAAVAAAAVVVVGQGGAGNIIGSGSGHFFLGWYCWLEDVSV